MEKNNEAHGIWSVPRFYMGFNQRWEQFLKQNAFFRDAQGKVRSKSSRERLELPAGANEVVASREALVMRFGTTSAPNDGLIENHFSKIKDPNSNVTVALEALRSSFDYNMALVLEQMHLQNRNFFNLLDQLDAIHNTLQSPVLTKAREMYRIGCDRLSKGLLDKALEAFLDSARIDDANFMTHLVIGKLYLYGVNDDSSVIDLDKADRHLREAARFAKAETSVMPEAQRFAAEAMLHAAISRYARANDQWMLGSSSDAQQLLQESFELAKQATQLDPTLSESFYHCAKLAALTGDGQSAAKNLESAIALDDEYCLKAEIDRDFRFVRKEMSELYERLRHASRDEILEKLQRAETWLRDWTFLGNEAKHAGGEIRQTLEEARASLARNTYFDNRQALQLVERTEQIFQSLLIYKNELQSLAAHSGAIVSLAFDPQGVILASGSADRSIKLWDATTGEPVRVLQGHSESVTKLAFSQDGSLLASVDKRGVVRLWDTGEGVLRRELPEAGEPVHCVAFSPDGRKLALGCYDRKATIWDTESGALLHSLNGQRTSVDFLTFSSDSRFLTTGTSDSSATLWDVAKGSPLRTFEGSAGLAKCLAAEAELSPAVEVATGEADSFHEDQASAIFVNGGTVDWVAAGSSRRVLALLNHERALQLWNGADGQLLHSLHPFAPGITSLRLNMDGTVLAASDFQDKSVKLWDVKDGSLLHVIAGNFSCAAFSPDSTMLVTGDQAGNLKYWGRLVALKSSLKMKLTTEPAPRTVERSTPPPRTAPPPVFNADFDKIRQHRMQRDQRQREGRCVMCGQKLTLLDKLIGSKLCRKDRY